MTTILPIAALVALVVLAIVYRHKPAGWLSAAGVALLAAWAILTRNHRSASEDDTDDEPDPYDDTDEQELDGEADDTDAAGAGTRRDLRAARARLAELRRRLDRLRRGRGDR